MSVTMLKPDDEDTVAVLFWMKAKWALRFQRAALEWLGAAELEELKLADPLVGYVPPFKADHGPTNAWALPEWSEEDDVPAATWLVNDLSSAQRQVLAAMLGAGPAGITTGEVKESAGYAPTKKASGIFRAIGGRCRTAGRRPMWRGGDKTPNGQRLRIPDGPARQLFISVLVENWPALAAEFSLS